MVSRSQPARRGVELPEGRVVAAELTVKHQAAVSPVKAVRAAVLVVRAEPAG